MSCQRVARVERHDSWSWLSWCIAYRSHHTLLLTRSSNLNHIYRPLSVQERNRETCEADVPARGVGDSLHTHQCKNDTWTSGTTNQFTEQPRQLPQCLKMSCEIGAGLEERWLPQLQCCSWYRASEIAQYPPPIRRCCLQRLGLMNGPTHKNYNFLGRNKSAVPKLHRFRPFVCLQFCLRKSPLWNPALQTVKATTGSATCLHGCGHVRLQPLAAVIR